jgi:hypothetical protein
MLMLPIGKYNKYVIFIDNLNVRHIFLLLNHTNMLLFLVLQNVMRMG